MKLLPHINALHITLLAIALAGLQACGGAPVKPLAGSNMTGADFAGSWELDLAQSDNIQLELDQLVRELRREAERRAQARGDTRGGPVIYGAGLDGASIIGLAQMAEYITRSQLLEIDQSSHDIYIKREENFALTCEFHGTGSHTVKNALGQEMCGWDRHQLVFWVLLPEGLRINHRLSLGPDGERLNIATTVYSDQVAYPFTLNRVYHRFDPEADGISCEVTLTRGKVCTTESQ
jgi:hypothetical protein